MILLNLRAIRAKFDTYSFYFSPFCRFCFLIMSTEEDAASPPPPSSDPPAYDDLVEELAAKVKPLSESQKRDNHLVTLAVGLVFIFIGLPVWWSTTTITRSDLSSTHVETLKSSPLKTEIQVRLVQTVSIPKFDDFLWLLEQSLVASNGQDFAAYKFKMTAPPSAFTNIDDLISKFHAEPSAENYPAIFLVDAKKFEKVTVDWKYSGSIVIPVSIDNPHQVIVDSVKSIIYDTYINPEELLRNSNTNVIASTPSIDIFFTNLIADPEKEAPSCRIDWESAIDEHLGRLLSNPLGQFRKNLEVKVRSQHLRYIDVGAESQKKGSHHWLDSDKINTIRARVEPRLGSYVSNSPALHLLLAVTPSGEPKLLLGDNPESSVNQLQGFSFPRWGGFVVSNCREGEALDVSGVMSVLGNHLLDAVGMIPPYVYNNPNGFLQDTPDGPLPLMALSRWKAMRSVINVRSTKSSVTSLVQMVDKVPNLQVDSTIAEQVHDSARLVASEVMPALLRGDFATSYTQSTRALVLSEKAFFHHSLLGLLYFPEDQKYAIYIPLFFPIGLPILFGLSSSFKWLFKEKGYTKLFAKLDDDSEPVKDKNV